MQKRKHALTVFDVCAGIGLLLLLLAAAYWMLRTHNAPAQTATVSYTVRISGADASKDVAILRGDPVTSENGSLPLGTVTGVTVMPHRRTAVRNGKIVTVEMPSRVDVEITVSGVGSYSEGQGFRISDVRIAAGETGTFCLGNYYAKGATVIRVAVAKGETYAAE